MKEENLLGLLGISQEEVDNEINGLALKVTGKVASAATRIIAKRFAEKKLKQTFVNRNLTKGQRFIMANFNKLTEETRKRIDRGVLRFKDANYYIRTNITGGGEINLITDALYKLPGVSNISKGQLPEQTNVAITRIEVNYDQSTTLTTADVKKADFRPISFSNTDSALENGELVIQVSGNEVLHLPINQINRQEKDSLSPANGFNLNSPVLIPEKEIINIKIVMSDGQTLDSSSSKVHFIDVILKGDEISQK